MDTPDTPEWSRYDRRVSPHLIRRVWAAVSDEPQLTMRALATQLGYRSSSGVSAALLILRDAGYIAFDDYTGHARTVLVPFKVDKRIRITKRS